HVVVGLEPRHLEVDPHERVVERCHDPTLAARRRAAVRARLLQSRPMTRRADLVELIGARALLRPLRTDDWPAWREVRLRCREWLEQWEPRGEPGAPDPALDREAFRARCAAWERQRHFDAAYGFGLFLHDGRFAGEVSLGSVQRGPFQMAYVG